MRRLLLAAGVAVALWGCKDTDGDGTRDGRDCAPLDPSVHPDATETCNGVDDDCNGQVDEDVAIVAYLDRDLDGWGDAAFARRVCILPEDGALDSGDCDDHDPQVHPDAPELCNGLDDDCDGEIDDDAQPRTFWADADGDGFGDPGQTATGCVAPTGFVGNANDCDDTDPVAWTGAEELCDAHDNDCDGEIDEGLPLVRVWADTDGDGSGDPAAPALACGPVPGFDDDDRDCDDTDPNLGGSAVDVQGNGIDEDCDGYVDEYGVPVPYATWQDALAAIGTTAGQVIQFDEGFHQVNVDVTGEDVVIAGEGCDRTVLYADVAAPVVVMDGGRVEGLTASGGLASRGGGIRVTGGEVWAVGVCAENNAADQRGGGMAVVGGTLHVHDSRVVGNTAVDVGGGIYGDAGTTLDVQRTLVLDNTASSLWGGGIGGRGATITVSNTVFAGNRAIEVGGAVYVGHELDAYGETVTGSGTIDHCTFHDNGIDPVAGTQGEAVIVAGTEVTISHSAFTGHAGLESVVDTRNANLTGTDLRVPKLTTSDLAFRGNTGFDSIGSYVLGADRGQPWYANVDPAVDPRMWDLRLTDRSEWIDAASDTDLDPDGSAPDLGAWGGPGAMWVADGPPLWRPWPTPDGARVDDADGDGLIDAWEDRWGTDRWQDDGVQDPDGDGATHLAEQGDATDPFTADTDADGVSDGDESTAGTNPLVPADNRPIAAAGPDRFARVGDPITVDGAGSLDPNGDALAYSWALVSTPIGSAATLVAPNDPAATFTPDVFGTYALALTVDDGTGSHTVTVTIDARTGPVVPDDAATPQLAAAFAFDGEAVFLRPGTWASVDLSGRDLALVGLGPADQVTVDAAGSGPAVRLIGGELAIASLTLTGGRADEGGGIHAEGASALVLRDVRVIGNLAGAGGGLYAEGTPIDASDVVLGDNHAGVGGGGWISGADAELTRLWAWGNTAWNGGALWLGDGEHVLDGPILQDNAANAGAGIWVESATAHLWNGAAAGNLGGSTILSNSGYVFSLGMLWIETNTTLTFDAEGGPTWRPFDNWNGGDVSFWYLATLASILEPIPIGDPSVVSWIDNGDPTDDLFAPRPGSPLIDVGWPEFVDRDGSAADIGPAAGTAAGTASLAGPWDTDGDGLSDAWERLFGLDPADPADAASDADGDGWTAADEYTHGTSPSNADTDGDGVNDAAEDAAGGDPTSARDSRPIAVVSTNDGDPRPGLQQSLFGTMSYDPDAGPMPLTYTWRFVTLPSGSSLGPADLLDANSQIARFTPDASGHFVIGLTVFDGVFASIEALVDVTVPVLLRVPSEYPTVDDAYAAAEPGDVVLLEPGIHDLYLDTWIDGVSIEGSGVDLTFVHGIAGYPVFDVDSGETAEIRDLTVAGANGNAGGGIDCNSGTIVAERVRFEFNAAWEGGAARSNGCDVTFVDVDMLDNDASSRGGGFAGIGGSLDWTRGELARNTSDSTGGAIMLDNVDAIVRNLVIHHNDTESSGAAIYQQTADAIPVTIEHCTIAANDGLSGAVYLANGSVDHTIVQQNAGYGFYESVLDPAPTTADWSGVWGNQSGDAFSNPAVWLGPNVVYEDARFMAFDPFDGGGWTADFHLRWDSPMIDAGELSVDLDRSREDIGAYGGAEAPPGWNYPQIDSDFDGLADAWEILYGTNPALNDAGADPDLDGRSNLWEYNNGTDPYASDTDGDGWNDAIEDPGITGWDPLDPSDHGPTADPGADQGGTVGVVAAFDGSASSDGDGDPITAWQWTLTAAPGRTGLGTADLVGANGPIVQLTPDFPGTWELTLSVQAGGVWSPPVSAELVVDGTVLVPEDYATVPDAIASAADGGTIDIGPGVWPTVATLDGKDLTLIGAGRDLTVLDGEGLGTVLRGDDSELLAISDLTITGGLAGEGAGLHLEGSAGLLSLTDVTLTGNDGVYGGAIYVKDAMLVTTRVRIVDNTAGRNGGGIYSTGSDIDIDQTLIAGNLSAALHGGGINHFNGELTVVNTVFSDNVSVSNGGAAYLNGPSDLDPIAPMPTTSSWFENVTMTYNEGSNGSAIKVVKVALTVRNAIIAHNRGDTAIKFQDVAATYFQEYTSTVDNDVANFDLGVIGMLPPTDGDAFGNQVGRNVALDGLSEDGDWTNDDWFLGAGSSAIDAGDPNMTDADGSAADMGAFGGPGSAWIP